MSDEVPQEVIAEAMDFCDGLSGWDPTTEDGSLRGEVRKLVEATWKKAFEAGHDKGYAEGVHEGGCDFCRF